MTRVKICGLTRLEDAQQAVELGAWALGMIFWPKSPRACPIEQAEAIGAQLHRRAELTGVFVNATLDEVATTADVCRFSMLQLHGDEGPAYCQEAARRTGCKIVKAARVRDAAHVRALSVFHTDFHLLDAHSPKAPGGTGESFDWELALLHPDTPPVILSGGLTSDNVADAIAAARPFAVDTASGTEAEPGRKDPAKLSAFFRAVEAAGV
ncbi:MAG TPA: phosphoribosylanthranilate isomerase, partial [Thermoleophilaceae bacterium]|nr:phosphoribosylanthranilate isomerase [Thermoleophilaceae bacterium]